MSKFYFYKKHVTVINNKEMVVRNMFYNKAMLPARLEEQYEKDLKEGSLFEITLEEINKSSSGFYVVVDTQRTSPKTKEENGTKPKRKRKSRAKTSSDDSK